MNNQQFKYKVTRTQLEGLEILAGICYESEYNKDSESFL